MSSKDIFGKSPVTLRSIGIEMQRGETRWSLSASYKAAAAI
jgi:hypothetical protein